ncbi:MAG: copper-binding protein [Maricaulaceae bacterium]
MKHTMKITLTALVALGLTACGAETSGEMDHSTMDHSTMDEGKMAGDTGHTTGVIFSISPDGKEATIDHQEIEGVGMGAMTMGFGITSTVDLTGYTKSDNVSFMVKKGRDGSYRITAICNTDTDGKDCLDAKMDHSGH